MAQDERNAEDLTFSPLDTQDAERAATAREGWRTAWLRRRTGRVALSTLCVLLVVGAVIALVSRGANSSLQTIYDDFTGGVPTPTAPILPGQDIFVAYNDAPWGKLTVDGRMIPFAASTPAGPGFMLPRGVHHLLYQASYFPTLRCVISVPQGAHDTCPLINHQTDGAGGVVDQERFLDLGAKPARLSHVEYQALLAAVNQTLARETASATIEPGERYVNAAGQTNVATAPLTYTLGVMLQSTELTPGDSPSLGTWPIQATAELTRAIGAGVPTPELLSPAQTPISETIDLAVTEDARGTWNVQDLQPDVALSTLAQGFWPLVMNSLGEKANQVGWGSTDSANPAEGIALLGEASGGQPQLVLLWRFDVLYAVNDAAARSFPQLPRANSAEQSLAMSAVKGLSTYQS